MDFDTALNKFIDHLTAQSEADRVEYPHMKPKVYTTQTGPKNIKVVTQTEGQDDRSVFCFIRRADGAVLKAASWKAPAKHPRGTIMTDNPSEYGVGKYGANYL